MEAAMLNRMMLTMSMTWRREVARRVLMAAVGARRVSRGRRARLDVSGI